MPHSPIQLAVLISGSGTTLQNLIDCINSGKLGAKILLVIASKPGIAGIDRAKNAGLQTEIVERKKFADVSQFSKRIFGRCDEMRIGLVCLAGWLSLLEIPPKWSGKAMNIHPALLPAFGGPGLYGQRVHQAVLDHGSKISGCTVHFVDATYDTGPIILQRCCPVLEGDTTATLAHRVFEEEKIAYPDAIRLFQSGRLRIQGRRTIVL